LAGARRARPVVRLRGCARVVEFGAQSGDIALDFDTAVALWIAAGASPKEIAARAGHTSVATVIDRYGHLLPGSESKVNDALDSFADAAVAARSAEVLKLARDGRGTQRA
jgi:hypothetical protein